MFREVVAEISGCFLNIDNIDALIFGDKKSRNCQSVHPVSKR